MKGCFHLIQFLCVHQACYHEEFVKNIKEYMKFLDGYEAYLDLENNVWWKDTCHFIAEQLPESSRILYKLRKIQFSKQLLLLLIDLKKC